MNTYSKGFNAKRAATAALSRQMHDGHHLVEIRTVKMGPGKFRCEAIFDNSADELTDLSNAVVHECDVVQNPDYKPKPVKPEIGDDVVANGKAVLELLEAGHSMTAQRLNAVAIAGLMPPYPAAIYRRSVFKTYREKLDALRQAAVAGDTKTLRETVVVGVCSGKKAIDRWKMAAAVAIEHGAQAPEGF